MNCNHCLINAMPDNKHMSRETFNDVLQFLKRINPLAVLITGGEPTEHPDMFFMVDELLKLYHPKQLILTSNGKLFSEQPDMLEELASKKITIHVVNDARYYPVEVIINHPAVEYFDYIPAPLFPAGRAKDNRLETTRMTPGCFNIRSAVRSQGNIIVAIKILELRGRFCTPVVDFDGTVRVGETLDCPAVGYINDSMETLCNNIKQFKCNACGLMNNLDARYRQAVGET